MGLQKNITFTVTHGRTGTQFISKLFDLCEETQSCHEPEPNFARAFPDLKNDPLRAVDFLDRKILEIEKHEYKNYVETSNVFGKGFLVPFIRKTKDFPNLLLLNRRFRNVALSLYSRGSTPVRTERGRLYSADPGSPGSLQVAGSDKFTDYQLCFWGVLDSFKRQFDAAELYEKCRRRNFVWCTAEHFHDWDFFAAVAGKFNLPLRDKESVREKHGDICLIRHNQNPAAISGQDLSEEILSDLEARVIDNVAFFDPVLAWRIVESEFVDEQVRALLKQEN